MNQKKTTTKQKRRAIREQMRNIIWAFQTIDNIMDELPHSGRGYVSRALSHKKGEYVIHRNKQKSICAEYFCK